MSEFKPETVSQEAWDKARHFLSEAFTVPIGNRLSEVISLSTDINNLEAYDYKMVTWEDFSNSDDVHPALYVRAYEWRKDGAFDFVIYDPLDDDSGMLLVGNDAAALAKEFCDYIADGEPDEGPLSPDKVAMAAIEGPSL